MTQMNVNEKTNNIQVMLTREKKYREDSLLRVIKSFEINQWRYKE